MTKNKMFKSNTVKVKNYISDFVIHGQLLQFELVNNVVHLIIK